MDPLCTKLWQKRAERFAMGEAVEDSEEVQIMVPVIVRSSSNMARDRYPFEACGKVAGYQHIALGETKEKAVANLRDWIVGQRVPEKVAGVEERKITLQWALDTAEAIECESYDGCCGCIDTLKQAVKNSLAAQDS